MLTKLSPTDRKKLGRAGLTKSDCEAIVEAKNERELQKQIVNYLRLRGIEVNVSRMDKRTTHRKGWADITFSVRCKCCVNQVVPCIWEVKYGEGKLSPEQEKLAVTLTTPPNCWRFRVIRSLAEAREELRQLGLG